MRYCVMCGMPLPHRPMTTPGAQSTLNFTRVPVESGSTPLDQSTWLSPSSATGVLEGSSSNGNLSLPDAIEMPRTISSQDAAPVGEETPPPELVPDVSLDEYIRKFHYEPPVDPGEVTMMGDAPPLVEPDAPAASANTPAMTDASPSESEPNETYLPRGPVLVRPQESETELPPTDVPADSVASRLGLEPESDAEERIQRPRFLDVNEPSKETVPAAVSGTSTIVGPSFLGLSDPPQLEVEPSWVQEEETPARGRWRVWLAAAVLVLFAVLGVMEWRSQANPSNQGILQVIGTKLRNWRHPVSPPVNSDNTAAAPAASDTTSKPETPRPDQGGATNPPQTSDSSPPPSPAASMAHTPNSAAALPASGTTPKPAADSSPKAETSSKNSAAGTTAKPPAATANSVAGATPRKPTPEQPPPAKASALGADEMAKAKNASDAAASAAWLWKATAKGNPEAPVQLADMYIKGNGVPRSCEQALVLLKTAAAKENATARNRLGSMYATATCVQRNRVEAYRWMSAALTANPYSQWAQQNREQIWQQMTPEEQAAAQKYR